MYVFSLHLCIIKHGNRVKRLVICSSKVNRNGYKVLAQGVVLTHYLENPVLMAMHEGKILSIGKMTDIKLEDGPDGRQILTGEPEFDMDDPLAVQFARKFEKGYINSCSMGHDPIETSSDPALADPGQIWETVTKTELLEISMTNIPGDRGAVTMKLTNGDVVELPKLVLNHNVNKESEMSLAKICKQLGIADDADETAIIKQIETLQLSVKQNVTEKVDALLTLGTVNGHVTDDNIENYRKLASADYDTVSKLLSVKTLAADKPAEEKPAAKQEESVADALKKLSNNKPTKTEDAETFEYLSINDPDKLLSIKINDPDKYAKLAADYIKGSK